MVGVRDKSLLMVLAYTAARASAVARLRTKDHLTDARSWSFEFDEKGGKRHRAPCRHDLQDKWIPTRGRPGCCHSFRATTATTLLKQKVPREQVKYRLGQSDARMTDLYDRSEKEVTRNIVDTISIKFNDI